MNIPHFLVVAAFTMAVLGGQIVFAQPHSAFRRITAGETVAGSLDKTDYIYPKDDKLSAQSVYDLYSYRGTAGEQIRINYVRKDGGTPYMILGIRGKDTPLSAELAPVDGVYTLPEDLEYAIALTGISYAPPGPYTLSVIQVKPGIPSRPLRDIGDGETRTGTLAPDSYQDWAFEARAGERVRVRTMWRKDIPRPSYAPNLWLGEGRGRIFSNFDITILDSSYSEGKDMVVTRDGLITIRVWDSGEKKGGEYSVSVEKFKTDANASNLPEHRRISIDDPRWRPVGRSVEGNEFWYDGAIQTLTAEYPRIYRFLLKVRLSKPFVTNKGEADTIIYVFEAECNTWAMAPVSWAAYKGPTMLTGGWTDRHSSMFNLDQIGNRISTAVCNAMAR